MEARRDGAPAVQWFPGHMAKTRRLIEAHLGLVDVVIELLDARAPRSSANPLLRELIGEKPRIAALNKADLAEEAATRRWLSYFQAQGVPAAAIDSLTGAGLKALWQKAESLARGRTHRLAAKGGKPRAARAMVVGIPNVGKSSLINRFAGATKARVENRPGVTRDKQWIRTGGRIELLDMPGILWPRFDDASAGVKLAFLGAVKDEVYDRAAIVKELAAWLSANRPERLTERYRLTAEEARADADAVLTRVGERRGCLLKGGALDMEKVQRMLLTDFRSGRLGRVTLDDAPERAEDAG